MASYPDGQFVAEFARRTHQNIEAIAKGAALTQEDTALVSFLLAVFVLPHERFQCSNHMAELLTAYPKPMDAVVRVLKSRTGLADTPPSSLTQLPSLLRHAVAHFNIRPMSRDEQNLTHLLVWNTIPENWKNGGKISYVAEIDIGELRQLALHILAKLQDSKLADRYEGIDPVKKFDDDWPVI